VIDRRFLAQFPEYRKANAEKVIVQSERGEIEVEVPNREEEPAPTPIEVDQEIRQSIKVQARVAELGAILGFSIWIPAGDRTRVSEIFPKNEKERLVTKLPLNFDTATIKTIENIDVIWLDRRSVAHAFEIEHTTSIYSGLQRFATDGGPSCLAAANSDLAAYCRSRLTTRTSPPRDRKTCLFVSRRWIYGTTMLFYIV